MAFVQLTTNTFYQQYVMSATCFIGNRLEYTSLTIQCLFMPDILTQPFFQYPAKRRYLFSLFASTAFQIWHFVTVPRRILSAQSSIYVSFCAPYFILFQYSTFIYRFDCSTDGWGDNSEQADKFRFTHPYIGNVFRHDNIARFAYCYDASSHNYDIW